MSASLESPRREFGVTLEVASAIEDLIRELGWWDRWPELAKAVIQLSDHFHMSDQATPWREPRFQAAYLAYFLPLNFARLKAVFAEAQNRQFPISPRVIDIGSGPGTGELAWNLPVNKWENWELDEVAIDLHRRLLGRLKKPESSLWLKHVPAGKGATLLAAYSLNEFKEWPAFLFEADHMLLVEPSTQSAGRRLMKFRDQLIRAGFYLWAPCTHQLRCPLLQHSVRDWCHDRIFFVPPPWWRHLEPLLPMKNVTLTFSYLLASRTPPKTEHNQARVIGDTLHERGKVKQAVCRGEEREFLSWLTRNGAAPVIPHGSLIELPENLEKKNSELRFPKN